MRERAEASHQACSIMLGLSNRDILMVHVSRPGLLQGACLLLLLWLRIKMNSLPRATFYIAPFLPININPYSHVLSVSNRCVARATTRSNIILRAKICHIVFKGSKPCILHLTSWCKGRTHASKNSRGEEGAIPKVNASYWMSHVGYPSNLPWG